jgi:hypothetical protein
MLIKSVVYPAECFAYKTISLNYPQPITQLAGLWRSNLGMLKFKLRHIKKYIYTCLGWIFNFYSLHLSINRQIN